MLEKLHSFSMRNIFKIFSADSPTSHVLILLSRSGSVLDLTPTRARVLVLCVMSGRHRLLGDACALTHKWVSVTLRYGGTG
jgi:hypothetical protein